MENLQFDLEMNELSLQEMQITDGGGLWGEFFKAVGMDLLVEATIDAIHAGAESWSNQVGSAGMYSGGYTGGYSSNPYH